MLLRVPIIVVGGLLALGLLGLPGCLIPYDIEERPIEVNYPPFYVEGTISPVPDDILEFDPRVDLNGVLLRVVLDDPNASDQLFYRWFIDYNPETSGATDPGRLEPGESGVISYTFDPCREGASGETVHRVDLLVADRAFLRTPGPPVNQHVADGTGTLRLTWFVGLDHEACMLVMNP